MNEEATMRTGWIAAAVVTVFGLGWTAGQVFSQDAGGKDPKGGAGQEGGAKPAEPEMTPEQKAEQEAWMKAATPGEPHKRMAELDGEWTVSGRFWMEPKGAPIESVAKAKFHMILGGRYQVQEYSGGFMGMDFEGFGFSGFDNTTKEHVGVWADSMGTGVMVLRGKMDEKGRVESSGSFVNPTGQTETMREVWGPGDNGTYRLEFFGKSPKHPEEFKSMEMVYTRKKAGDAPK
jgi:hypothetical protein